MDARRHAPINFSLSEKEGPFFSDEFVCETPPTLETSARIAPLIAFILASIMYAA
jgi:hypothetical protein